MTTFGPGAMVDLIDHAVVVSGVDLWCEHGQFQPGRGLAEPRLRARVCRALDKAFPLAAQDGEGAERRLSAAAPFREPPEDKDDKDGPSRATGIPVYEFPHWFACQRCHALVRSSELELRGKRYHHRCDGQSSMFPATPTRFVAACAAGHLDDFPWRAFIHSGGGQCTSPRYYIDEGPSGDLGDVKVECRSCGAKRSLADAKQHEHSQRCFGARPWFRDHDPLGCEEDVRLIVRTASNSYFPWVMSALTVPDALGPLVERILPHRDLLEDVEREALATFRGIKRKALADVSDLSDDEVWAALQSAMGKAPSSDEGLRSPEYRRFLAEPLEKYRELAPEGASFFARRAKVEDLPPQLERIVLASKLREVRALLGFTRLEGATPNLQGEFDLGVRSSRVALHKDWLPATEILGEGVLIVLSEEALIEWEGRAEVCARSEQLRLAHAQWAQRQRGSATYPGVRFYLLHTLSHLLITAISLECGYAASAIRERIYCSEPGEKEPMGGILLHTGTTGSEGTLGGLVHEGRRIGAHLRRARLQARLCSNDPVCAHHRPDTDPSERELTAAACHGCLFVAESSCERWNSYLDRALVVPVIGQPARLAFFEGLAHS